MVGNVISINNDFLFLQHFTDHFLILLNCQNPHPKSYFLFPFSIYLIDILLKKKFC